MKHIGSTTRVLATHNTDPNNTDPRYTNPQLIWVTYYRDGENIHLQPVCGRTIKNLPERQIISDAEFQNRPQNYTDKEIEATWAINKCGWTIFHW